MSVKTVHELLYTASDDECIIHIDKLSDINITNICGSTLLMQSVIMGRIKIAEYLIKCGCDIDAVNHNNTTALMYACSYDRRDICQLLIKNNANVNMVNAHNKSAIIMAYWESSEDTVIDLLKSGAKFMDLFTLLDHQSIMYDTGTIKYHLRDMYRDEIISVINTSDADNIIAHCFSKIYVPQIVDIISAFII
ncbi:MAG: hypothetical protein Faunusvirus45_7 [Faunusvirus sp.]|jgi:ankyrin repeat protein|uniref:Uncharacterized protein n=1 Tax=Faunusvirus sp. TaxID=2487766 RepID=A0A3G4ZXV6_9VIRU|nr:MAG: hypothetical protein Faunusvirus45_7 [Faunusvirus sp.]